MFDRQKTIDFIYRYSRPLDLARYRFHFEQASSTEVLSILAHYQNADGGFGHGLEPDFLNPQSTPIATWAAVNILRETKTTDSEQPLVAGVLRYLASGNQFNGNYWYNTVPENNDYPHAIWWQGVKDYDQQKSENPTVSLAAFFLRCGDKDLDFYSQTGKILKQCVGNYLARTSEQPVEPHVLNCFIEAYEDLVASGLKDLIDLPAFAEKLKSGCDKTVEKTVSRWATSYVPRPSNFVKSHDSLAYLSLKDLVEVEKQWLWDQQNEEGTWPVTWSWMTDYPEAEAVSKVHWQASFAIDNLLFLDRT